MIRRLLEKQIKTIAKFFPVVAVLGPRQSGKTTLVKSIFKKYKYISFEEPDNRLFAEKDPRVLLATFEHETGVILDEIQNVPSFLSYLQTYVDQHKKKGFFILTGSQNLPLHQAISQTLTGRIGILKLLPLSIDELHKAKLLSPSLEETIFSGFYPRIYDDAIPPSKWYANYIQTYLERDVRQIENVVDVSLFQKFVTLCAGLVGQSLNIATLAHDCGITVATAEGWLSFLQSSYIIFLLRPHHKNLNKRMTKNPKLYFYDTGLVCNLLDIKNAQEVSKSSFKGGLFECFVIAELFKQRFNNDQKPTLYFWRDQEGHEVDCLIEDGLNLTPVEIKLNKKVSGNDFDGLHYWNKLAQHDNKKCFVVYGGNKNQRLSHGNIVGWQSIGKLKQKS